MTHTPQTPTVPERFASILMLITHSVVKWGLAGSRSLPSPLVSTIIGHLREIKQRFALLTHLISEGKYRPRRPPARCETPPETTAARKPPAPSRFPRKFGWLIPLLPLHEINSYRFYLEQLLGDPEMQALLAAAPSEMGRPIRSLCWMLRLPPPPAVARPPRPKKPKPQPPAEPVAVTSEPEPSGDAEHRLRADWSYRPSANWPHGVGRRWRPPKPKTA